MQKYKPKDLGVSSSAHLPSPLNQKEIFHDDVVLTNILISPKQETLTLAQKTLVFKDL